jgi:hypothetical protein
VKKDQDKVSGVVPLLALLAAVFALRAGYTALMVPLLPPGLTQPL